MAKRQVTAVKRKTKKAERPKYELDDVARSIAAIRKVGREMRANPKKARQYLIDLGIYTKSGRLSKNYGG